MATLISKIDKAKSSLILDQPFFASILLAMPITEDSSIPTMSTDGDSIKFNPEFTEKLTLNETIFVLAHEVLHCVFDHMGRRGSRTPNRWNQAADYVINELLVAEKIGAMPVGALLNPSLTKRGENTAEGVYKFIPEENEGKKPGDKPGPDGFGPALDDVKDSGPDKATREEKESQRKVKIVQARNVAKSYGKLSAGIDRLVSDLVKPQVDWREVLRNFVSQRAKVESTWAKPKRRFLAEDFYLPSLSGQKLGKLVVAVDCSDSVNESLLAEFATEINAIREDLKPSALDVVYFDSRVCKVDSIQEDQDLKIIPVGGGGTAFSPVFEFVDSMSEQPEAVVFLTDLVCNDFGPKPSYPVLWAVLGGLSNGYDSTPFGEIVEVKSET